MADKLKLKYRVVSGRNPRTGGTVTRPVITERETYYMDQVVDYALNAGYVRGQFQDMKGALNGFVEAIQQLGRNGKAVNLNNWLRVHAELTGKVGENHQLTEANELHVAITALTDLKAKVSDFSWTNVEDSSLLIKVENLSSPGGAKGEIIKTKAIIATGKNLAYSTDWGDKVIVTWKEDDEEKSLELTPSEASETYLRFDWPTGLASVPVNTELTFSFRLHGSADAAEQVSTRTAKLIAA